MCANCGISQIDDIKLEGCDGCQSNRLAIAVIFVKKITGSSTRESVLNCMAKNYFKQPAQRQLSRRVSDLFFAALAKSTNRTSVHQCIKHGAKIINEKDSSCSEKYLS